MYGVLLVYCALGVDMERGRPIVDQRVLIPSGVKLCGVPVVGKSVEDSYLWGKLDTDNTVPLFVVNVQM